MRIGKKEKIGLITIVLLLIAIGLSIYVSNDHSNELSDIPSGIIAEDASVEKDADGNYIYEDLNETDAIDYIIPIAPYEEELQVNECMVDLLGKVSEKGNYTCSKNGYTYVAVSYGKSKDSVSISFDPLLNKDDDKLKVGYRFTVIEMPDDNAEDIGYAIMQIPTDKEIVFGPLDYVEQIIESQTEDGEIVYNEKNEPVISEQTIDIDPYEDHMTLEEVEALNSEEVIEE